MSHNAGHLWPTIFGWKGNPHFSIPHIASDLLIFGGFILLSSAWSVLYQAQRNGRLATTGVYARLRHPQYAAFIIIMIAFLLQWPTIPTLVMFPLLVFMYLRVAHTEEQEARAASGAEWEAYAAEVPRWIPRMGAGTHRSRLAR
ncbi:MAG: isoprenylcysteine carboxylmethyltransferase family protein [Rhodospirillales bacterium]|nr:isoprenylcysteine carboxylmethyltransferase family protein [Rhodospirillales bacterium]